MIKLFSFAIALMLTAAAFAADVTPHTLISDAGSQVYWVARNDHRTGIPDTAMIYNRALGQDDHWNAMQQPLPVRIDALAAQDSALGVLTGDGAWLLIYDEQTIVTGGALPAAPRMLALAAGQRDWWAIGEVPGGMEAVRIALERSRAASQPAATRPVAASQPATTQSSLPRELILFHLEGNDWSAVAPLPTPPSDSLRLALTVVDNRAYVASFDGGVVTVVRRDRGDWIPLLRVDNIADIASFKLLADGPTVRLWVQRQQGPDLLYWLDNGKTQPLSLAGLQDIPARDRTAALFGQGLRIIGVNSTGGVLEQRFALDTGEPQGKPASILLPNFAPLMTLQEIHSAILFTSMLLVFVGWIRVQSDEEDGPEPKPLLMAPLGLRLAAGLIDLAPVMFTMLFFYVHYRDQVFMLLLAYWASGLFYVLMTTTSEVIGGRTLGKIILRLKVVNRQGEEPTALALLTRNVLRMFDLSLFFLPVLAIVFSPARQRAGDLAAGTVVIYDAPKPEKESE